MAREFMSNDNDTLTSPAPAKLRGHHFLCILTYVGTGYTQAFEENFNALAEQLNRNGTVEITTGIDDICAALHKEQQVVCSHARVCKGSFMKPRDRVALKSVSHTLQMPVPKEGEQLSLGKGEIRYLREHFIKKTIRRACTGCGWFDACTEIAENNFSGVKVRPDAVPTSSRPPQHAYGQSS